ncbi:MAG: hypothetical protein ACI89J_003871 [Hyphomicrobiaceae bacterium]
MELVDVALRQAAIVTLLPVAHLQSLLAENPKAVIAHDAELGFSQLISVPR